MSVTAHDFADELERLLPNVPRKKLHKLLYYVQGWHLARTGEPAFTDRLAAYKMGPVVVDLLADQRHGRGRPESGMLSAEHHLTISVIVERYGHLTGKQLEEMTHRETPWVDAWPGDDEFARILSNDTITVDAVRSWFVEVDRSRSRLLSFADAPRSVSMDTVIQHALAEDPIVGPDRE